MTTHQVLARKWRPQTFADVSGQKPIVRALSNALLQRRLHHAYLLTGTRGVGKTSLARILAKCLNCEQGSTNEPCRICTACQAIENGQFIDLIEIDAASRSGVDDIRQLLENVQYMPTMGRYKVYLIDEVHMLSHHSFNALLKTLEEPPAHVVFILATTDPDRLPVTILSRCLHFQLRAMTPEQIIQRLTIILQNEQISFAESALATIANAAQGSMRDALSLLDQVIALGSGNVTEEASLDLLGGMSTEAVLILLQTILENKGKQAMEIIQHWLSEGVDFESALDTVIDNLHQISVLQVIPDMPEPNIDLLGSCHSIRQKLAQQLPKEQIQLYYQIALYGKRDLPYAPTPRIGFEMTVLRMLAFSCQPQHSVDMPDRLLAEPADALLPDWAVLITELALQGPAKILAQYCILKEFDGTQLILVLEPKQAPLLTSVSQEKLTTAISRYFEKTVCVKIEIGQPGLPCPANIAKQQNLTAQSEAEQSLSQDQGLQFLLKQLNADIEPSSILPKSSKEKNQ